MYRHGYIWVHWVGLLPVPAFWEGWVAEKEACLVGYLLTTRSGSESAGPGKRRPGQIGVKAGRV